MSADAFFVAEKVAETLERWSGSAWVRIPPAPGLPVEEFNLTDRVRRLRLLPPRHPDHRPRNVVVHDMARLATTWDQQERLAALGPEVMAGKQFQPGFAYGPPDLAGAEANLRNVADRRVRAALEEHLRLARAQQVPPAGPYEETYGGDGGYDEEFDPYAEAVYGDVHADPTGPEPGRSGPPPSLDVSSFFPVTQTHAIKG